MSKLLEKLWRKVFWWHYTKNGNATEELKAEVWRGLSELYYRFDSPDQKTAFRKVIEEMRGMEWKAIHRRIYREEHGY